MGLVTLELHQTLSEYTVSEFREFIEVDNHLFRVYIFCHTMTDRIFTAVIQKQYRNKHIF